MLIGKLRQFEEVSGGGMGLKAVIGGVQMLVLPVFTKIGEGWQRVESQRANNLKCYAEKTLMRLP